MDESGFTGDDLYNPNQPHFVISSTLIGDEEASEILRRCFPRYQGPEFKFTTIWRREAHHDGLRAFAREIPALSDRIFLWVVDKRFSLLVKMFDYLVEPSLYAAGRDFYAGGYAMRYLNTVHRDILKFGTPAMYDDAVRLWDAFARNPSAATMAPLRTYLEDVAQTSRHPISTIFAMMHEGTKRFEASNERLEDFTDSSEIQVTSILSTMTYWRQHRAEDFDLVHDESASFLRQQDLWETLVCNDAKSLPFEQANGTIVELPLRVRSTTAAKSQDSPAIQLCDLLAGLGAKMAVAFDKTKQDPFLLELAALGAGELISGGVRPHDDYANGPAPPRDGPDMLDRMTEFLEPHLAHKISARAKRSE